MNLNIIKTLIQKDIILFFRDKFFGMMSIVAFFMYIVFYFIMPNSVDEKIEIGFYSPLPTNILNNFENGVVLQKFQSEEELKKAILNQEYLIGISVPSNIKNTIFRGKQFKVFIYYSSVLMGELKDIYSVVIDEMFNQMFDKNRKIKIVETVIGPDMGGKQIPLRDRFLPMFAFIILIMETFVLANLITSEIRTKAVQALLTTPMNIIDLFIGKGITGVLLAFSQAALFLVITGNLANNTFLILLLILFGSIMVTGLAFFIASISKDILSVVGWGTIMMIVLMLPAITVMFPGPVSGWMKIIPSFFLVNALDRTINYNIGFNGNIYNLSALIGFNFLFVIVGILSLKRRLTLSIQRIYAIFKKDLRHGLTGYFFIFAIAAPIILTIVVNLVFGSIFSGKPKLGILDVGNSVVVKNLQAIESLDVKNFNSKNELEIALNEGKRDVGVIFEENFDELLKTGELKEIAVYIWGESLLKDRVLINAALLSSIREITGRKKFIQITPISLGEQKSKPWKDRLLPIIILMAIFISGLTIPSSSLVDEKENRTLSALLSTPTSVNEVFFAKGIIGVMLSFIMGTIILILNGIFISHFGLLLLILFLGAIMAGCLGLILGAYLNEMASLYTAIKGFGILLYAPGIVNMFPGIPSWIGKIFPTYYIMNPIMNITIGNGNWSTVQNDLLILFGIILLLYTLTGFVANRTTSY